jgi:hypothetical protein
MHLPDTQKEIVSRRYGLTPYEEESSAREISRVMNIHRERVSRILSAFADEMKTPNGSFHRVVSVLSADDLQELGIPWVSSILGVWHEGLADKHKISSVLTEEIGPVASNTVWYRCVAEGSEFRALVEAGAPVADAADCPKCGGQSFLRPRS